MRREMIRGKYFSVIVFSVCLEFLVQQSPFACAAMPGDLPSPFGARQNPCGAWPSEGKGKTDGSKNEKVIAIPREAEYESGIYHSITKLRVKGDDYVLEKSKLPDEPGKLKRVKDHLYLTPTAGGVSRTPDLVHIRWGPRSYLVEPKQLIWFCNEVNRRDEPTKDGPPAVFLLRDGDWEKEAKGVPEVPDEVRAYLLPKPIRAKIVEVKAYQKEVRIVGYPAFQEGYHVVIDHGKKDGALQGMRFSHDTASTTFEAYVLSVEDRTSELLFIWYPSYKLQLRPGLDLSTRDKNQPNENDSKGIGTNKK
jgi:hypothetical protein